MLYHGRNRSVSVHSGDNKDDDDDDGNQDSYFNDFMDNMRSEQENDRIR